MVVAYVGSRTLELTKGTGHVVISVDFRESIVSKVDFGMIPLRRY